MVFQVSFGQLGPLEAGGPRSRCQHGQALGEGPLPGLQMQGGRRACGKEESEHT